MGGVAVEDAEKAGRKAGGSLSTAGVTRCEVLLGHPWPRIGQTRVFPAELPASLSVQRPPGAIAGAKPPLCSGAGWCQGCEG